MLNLSRTQVLYSKNYDNYLSFVFFYNFVLDDSGMSGKQKKALQLLEKKHDIEILSESEFLNRL